MISCKSCTRSPGTFGSRSCDSDNNSFSNLFLSFIYYIITAFHHWSFKIFNIGGTAKGYSTTPYAPWPWWEIPASFVSLRHIHADWTGTVVRPCCGVGYWRGRCCLLAWERTLFRKKRAQKVQNLKVLKTLDFKILECSWGKFLQYVCVYPGYVLKTSLWLVKKSVQSNRCPTSAEG